MPRPRPRVLLYALTPSFVKHLALVSVITSKRLLSTYPSSLAGWGGGGGSGNPSTSGGGTKSGGGIWGGDISRSGGALSAAEGQLSSSLLGCHVSAAAAAAASGAAGAQDGSGASAQDGSAAGFLLENGLKLRLAGGGSGEPYRALVAESST